MSIVFGLACILFLIPQGPEVELVVNGLDLPTSVAIDPLSGAPFVAESGAGRVVRVDEGECVPVISNFPTEVFSGQKKYPIGPLSLQFLPEGHLAVGEGGLPPGEDGVLVFDTRKGQGLVYADAKSKWTLPATADAPGEGNFFSLANSGNKLFVACHGDDRKGWIASIDLTDASPKLKRTFATWSISQTHAPTAIAFTDKGHTIIGLQGELNVRYDSALAIFDSTGEPVGRVSTGLNDIVSLFVDPSSQRLFALDFSEMVPSEGGLYELTNRIEGGSCTAVKIVDIEFPTSMAIGKDGSLYVTKIDFDESEREGLKGSLLRIRDWCKE